MDSFLFRIIMYISIVVWLFPPIKHFKQNLFYFFLVLALTDPIALLLGKYLRFPPYLFYNFSAIITLYTVSNFSKPTKRFIIFYVILLIVAYLASHSPSKYTFYYIIFIHFIILLKFLKRTLLFIVDNNFLNIFHMVLILYETTIILKMLSVVENFSSGVYYYAITNVFQIIIAIFFTIFKENDKRLFFDLRKF